MEKDNYNAQYFKLPNLKQIEFHNVEMSDYSYSDYADYQINLLDPSFTSNESIRLFIILITVFPSLQKCKLVKVLNLNSIGITLLAKKFNLKIYLQDIYKLILNSAVEKNELELIVEC